VAVYCDTFARAAKENRRGLGLRTDYRCIVFSGARPRTAAGEPLSRAEVIRKYFEDPAKVYLRPKSGGRTPTR